jgi:hypothetical protein
VQDADGVDGVFVHIFELYDDCNGVSCG